MSAITQPPLYRWSYEQWDRAVESGVFEGQRVELIDGEIVEMSPQFEPHVAAIVLAAAVLRRIFGEKEFIVRQQAPLRLGSTSEPEPDIAVVKGTARDFIKTGHPQDAILVVEVSHSSLAYDRGNKASLYASAGITDYWIINLLQRQLEVHRKPIRDAKARFGFRYSQITTFKKNAFVAPLAARKSKIAVADMLP
jgi:Uma2 family endonuclease